MIGSVSIKTIAKELQISATAVSKALSDSPDISQSTKDKVWATANRLGYVKNSLAVSLKRGTTKNVAIFINDLYNPYFAIMVDKIMRLLDKRGYTGFICFLHGHELTAEGLKSFFQNRCSLAISLVDPKPEVVKTFADNDIPFFLIGILPKEEGVNYAITDDYGGGRLAGQYFKSKRHKKGLFVTNSPSETSFRRQAGFLDECKGLDVGVFTYEDGEHSLSDAASYIKENKVDLAFCHSDYVAITLRRMLRREGADIDILGYDNISQYVDLYDPVSSIGPDAEELVKEVVEAAISFHQGRGKAPLQKVFGVKLYER